MDIKEMQSVIKEGDTIIFRVDEYRNGYIMEMVGNVWWLRPEGVDVLYLSGFRSRNDLIEWKDIIAKVDLSKPSVKLDNAPFSGHFHVFQ